MLPQSTSIKIIAADDHSAVRRGLKDFFCNNNLNNQIEVLGIASSGEEVLQLLETAQPDVLLVDIRMGEMSGIHLCKEVKRKYPNVAVIAYSMFDDAGAITDMQKAGASGHLLKSCDEEEIITAIKAVHNGGEYYCSSIKKRIASLFATGSLGPATDEKRGDYSTTELEIIKLVCQEQSSKEIASQLQIDKRCVDHHKEKIQCKMGVKGVVGIAVYAIKNWLLYSILLFVA